MRKLWTLLFLLLSLACVFVACDEGNTPNENDTPPAVCQHRDANDDSLCDKCSESYTDGTDSTPPAHTHTWGAWSVTTPATCQTKGVETRTCVCGEDETRDVAINPDAHSFGDWGVTTPATCQTKGTETRSCACGKDETRDVAINPEAHSFGDWGVTTPATCQTKGLETRTCACGEDETRDVNKNADNHVDWSDWSVTTPATCQTKGVETRSCACGEDDTREIAIDLSAHTEVTDAAVAPTDTTDGLTEGKHCEECGKVLVEQEIVPALLQGTAIKSQLLTINGDQMTATFSNVTEIFSFLTDITVAKDATYVVARDLGCEQTINSKTVFLEIGDNTYFLLVTNGNAQKLYTVTVRRRPMYSVSFTTNGGTAVEAQTVEEGSLATEPTTIRAGYTFTGWNYDFTTPITGDTSISASWTANTNTPYKVEYYLQNLDNNNYTRLDSETENLTGKTDTEVTAKQKTFAHFTLNTDMSTLSGNLNGNGTLVLKVYYTRNSYTVSGTVNNGKAGSITAQSGTYRYDKELTFTATTNAGYTFLGWFDGETKVCQALTYTFRVNHDATYTAKWSINTDTPYKVEYYLQNLDNDLYTLHKTENWTGTTDTKVTAEQKTFAHFTLNTDRSTLSGNVNGDGTLVLKVYYTRNKYTLSNANTSYGSITRAGSHKYGASVTATATAHIGCEFLGWYSGNERISTDATYTFTVEKNVEARFGAKAEMANFNFTSTATTCTITGLKDKTITEIVVPDYVTCIGSSAFYGCRGLTSITLPFVGASSSASGYQSHFGYIFGYSSSSSSSDSYHYCDYSQSGYKYFTYYIPASLRSVTITDGVTSIGVWAFRDCSELTSVTIPNSVTSIGSSAFYGCSGIIQKVNGVSYVDKWVIDCDTSVTSVTLRANTVGIGDSVFEDYISLTSITIPESVTSIGSRTFLRCRGLKTVTFAEGSKLTSIGSDAFCGCSGLTSITIPNSVTSIGSDAFYGCSGLTSITIPNSVTSISSSAFGDCSSLTSITIGNGVTSIGFRAFRDCSSLTSITIPNSVTSIGYEAFRGCSGLTSITIPNSVTSIGDYAFSGCSGLISIKYRGTKEQWSAIDKDWHWDHNTGYTINYEYTGE